MVAFPILQMPAFGGFRHYLFILPPIFIFSGIGIKYLLDMIERAQFRILLVVLALIPGIIGIIRLHPYEYIFFNSLSGGVSKAQNNFELDYWCTSYKEAIEYLNREAPPNATIVAWGPTETAKSFARQDLNVLSERQALSQSSPDYAIACANALRNPDFYAGYRTIYEVTVNGAVIAKITEYPN
jgi:hypothetical protein